ncbi:hypothetical protein FUA23_13760 [Neolewinella aurantiaca]|uniref:Uncharacterized protein n=1 Tax=Neolewinella aurantiaca TaxID=2602767 RepID=A0A5C7FQL1_9BACT|nr:hypothetical protein [Neolewinella aurantiaca]TXF88726.1 hypothetical protein FUA23_13760 [Neolewinella aurantiaca]
MTEISLRLKRLGKKRVHTVPYRIPTEVKTLSDLIRVTVTNEVERSNASRTEPKLFAFLSPAEIQEQSQDGKVGFGEVANTEEADLDQAISVALQAHADGVFLVFLNDDEIRDLEQEIILSEGSEVTFIRLTFLTGLLW